MQFKITFFLHGNVCKYYLRVHGNSTVCAVRYKDICDVCVPQILKVNSDQNNTDCLLESDVCDNVTLSIYIAKYLCVLLGNSVVSSAYLATLSD